MWSQDSATTAYNYSYYSFFLTPQKRANEFLIVSILIYIIIYR